MLEILNVRVMSEENIYILVTLHGLKNRCQVIKSKYLIFDGNAQKGAIKGNVTTSLIIRLCTSIYSFCTT